MRQYKGENGKPLGIRPNKLWYSPDLEETAENIILKDKLDDGSSNTLFKRYDLQPIDETEEENLWGMVDLRQSTRAPIGWAHGLHTDLRWLLKPGDLTDEGLWGNDYDAIEVPVWWQKVTKCVHTP